MAPSSWYSSFDWEHAPLTHWCCPIAGVAAYLLVIIGLSVAMKKREAFQLRNITVVHNLVLSIGSLIMFLGTVIELLRRYASSGTFVWFFCEDVSTKSQGPLYFWSYIYYLSKYYEMLDTVFVLLQKSRVPNFKLQVYHHAAVAPTIWLWGQYRQSLQWGGLLFNTFVHVVMYHYYAWRVLGLPTPWKRWITKLQIIQFVTSFALLCVTMKMLSEKEPGETCSGMRCLGSNIVFNATLLFQFIGVDRRNAVKSKSEDAPEGSREQRGEKRGEKKEK